jgi:hypothetical protein
MADKGGVRTKHKDYCKFENQWSRCRAVMAGQDAVHAATVSFLPKLKEQTDADYDAYKKRAVFYNASWRTVAGLVGMMFRKPPKQELPAKILPYLANINMQGSPFDQFSQDVSTDVLEVGRIGLLVDHPAQPIKPDNTPVTVADAEAIGLRPTIQSYEAETIINWKYRNVNNATVLCLVVLTEQVALADNDEFSDKRETQYRVLDLQANNTYRQRMFRIDKNDKDEQVGADIIPLMNGKPLDFIPFVFIGPDGTNACPEEPPLIDLVDLNLSHYRVTADYEHGVHFSALPTFWISGYQAITDKNGVAEKIYLGSQSAIILPQPEARVGFAEVQNKFESHRNNLDAKKQEMATLGARMLADSSEKQVETFGATAIKHVAENSILAAIAISVSRGLAQALTWFSEWAGADSKIVYDINRDFMPVQMDAQTLTAIVAALQGGVFSQSEVFDLLKRGDMIEADKTIEQHQGEIDTAPPPAPPSNTRPGELGTMTPDEQLAHEKKKAAAIPPKKIAA